MRREPVVFVSKAAATRRTNIWHKLNVTGGPISLMLEMQREIEATERRQSLAK